MRLPLQFASGGASAKDHEDGPARVWRATVALGLLASAALPFSAGAESDSAARKATSQTLYDDKGRVVGRAHPRLDGGYSVYDTQGRVIRRLRPNSTGGMTIYDMEGRRIGRAEPSTR